MSSARQSCIALRRANRSRTVSRSRPVRLLAKILGLDQFDATSWHHQALRGTAAGFEAVAHAPDGSIEAIEMPGHPWLIAVQWHPELSAASDPVQQKLFDAIVAQARK